MPQQDILSHPQVKVVSHGGLLGSQEAVYHATPMLILPIHGDQPRNALNFANKGLGLYLKWKELTVDRIVQSLQEILNNPRYKEMIQGVSATLRDQLQSPRDRAVFWTEYVICHPGAPQLRSPGAQLSWVQFLMLDVLALTITIVYLTIFILRKNILYFILSKNITKKQPRQKRE
ncbi:UDP-glucuronosyltransferase 2B14-like 1 [Homarus americanus]|uniref:UDP-glucuronosyltransferase 2B14-like 1 n=1 Tax=Homarus americanus TaxID=6706 RepID=A0A8J5N2E4_HOMAM|nr:UDP-glucuronosyltransferase 2B14-like 1 [Homarus americanus]